MRIIYIVLTFRNSYPDVLSICEPIEVFYDKKQAEKYISEVQPEGKYSTYTYRIYPLILP